jgi:hypothetical protein
MPPQEVNKISKQDGSGCRSVIEVKRIAVISHQPQDSEKNAKSKQTVCMMGTGNKNKRCPTFL